jgi:hypothetical protein
MAGAHSKLFSFADCRCELLGHRSKTNRRRPPHPRRVHRRQRPRTRPELDRAALRAETGLAQLRQATDEAVDLLAGRIEKARELTATLERLTSEAPRPRPANDVARPAAPDRAWSRSAAAPVDPVQAAESLARRLSDDSLVLRDRAPQAMTRPAVRPAQPRPVPSRAAAQSAPQPRPARARSSFDDDLFEAPALALGALNRSR